MCVGNNFAMFEMILVLVEVIKKYEVSSKLNAIEINPLISLKPKNVPLYFKMRVNN